MEDLSVSLELRFTANVAGYEFSKDLSCTNITVAESHCRQLQSAGASLVAARIDIDVHNPKAKGGCYVLDDASLEVFGSLCNTLRVEPESFLNQACGSYDPLTNRVTPADFGYQFPGGSFRVVWEEAVAEKPLLETIRILQAALELLGAMQDRPAFQPTEMDLETSDWRKRVMERRIVLLFDAGCWPDSEGQFDDEAFEDRYALLDTYPVETAANS